MKKKYIIILLIVLLVGILVFVSIRAIKNKSKNDELEAVQIFENLAALQVFVENSNENINDIQENLENLEYVKNVKLISNEDALNNLKNEMNSNILDDFSSDIFPNSFIITFDINSVEDFEKIKTLEDNIASIDGVRDVEASGCNEIIEVYEKTGIKGMREYNKIMTIMHEQGIDGVNNYLEEHKETRALLKDFIHF